MPKLKTHKGMKKRFKVSATGKVSHKRCGSSHLNEPQERQAGSPPSQEVDLLTSRPKRSGSARACRIGQDVNPQTWPCREAGRRAERRRSSQHRHHGRAASQYGSASERIRPRSLDRHPVDRNSEIYF